MMPEAIPYSENQPLFFVYGQDVHVISDQHLIEIPTGNIDTAYRFACGETFPGYTSGGVVALPIYHDESLDAGVTFCTLCESTEIWRAQVSELQSDRKSETKSDEEAPSLGTLKLWICDVEQEMIEFYAAHSEKMYSMSPDAFEQLIAAVFHNQGFDVERTPKTRDGGFDFVAVHHPVLTGRQVYLVECKRYARGRTVGVAYVRSLYGIVHDRQATKGILATTGRFTRDARVFGQRNFTRMSLSEYEDIVAWLQRCKQRR